MTSDTGTRDVLAIMELLLTAEVFNRNEDLGINDLRPRCREVFSAGSSGNLEVKRPLIVSEGAIKKVLGSPDAICQAVRANPFVGYDEFGQRLSLPSLDAAAGWFLKKGGEEKIRENPVLAYFFEGKDGTTVQYQEIRAKNPRFEDTKEYMEAKVSRLIAGSEEMREARDLIIISAPDEVEFSISKLVCTPRQEEIIRKIGVALEHRDFLKEHGIYEFGRLLFVGPPGTGKTSLALAMSGRSTCRCSRSVSRWSPPSTWARRRRTSTVSSTSQRNSPPASSSSTSSTLSRRPGSATTTAR
jgi:hypothetical protein